MSTTKSNSNIGFTNSASLDQRWRLQERQLMRIQNKLEEFLLAGEARETTSAILDLVLEVDLEISRILRDPLVGKLYEYDSRFFTPKYKWGFYRAFDGIHILRSLSGATLETFFYRRGSAFCDPMADGGAGKAFLGGKNASHKLGRIGYVERFTESGAR